MAGPGQIPSVPYAGWTLSAGYASDTGCQRKLNEDCVQFTEPSDAVLMSAKGVLLVVADGMGGSEAGEVASRIAVHIVTTSYYASPLQPVAALQKAFDNANSEIRRFATLRPEWRGMGSTCTALVVENGFAHSAHVGDSRMYLLRGGRIYRLTEDHSAVSELLKKGSLTPEQARTHPDRNIILRALGGHERIETAVWEQPLAVMAGDRFLLCTDGLHETVTDDEIRRAMFQDGLTAICEGLVGVARQRGGPDNITVAILAADTAVPVP